MSQSNNRKKRHSIKAKVSEAVIEVVLFCPRLIVKIIKDVG